MPNVNNEFTLTRKIDLVNKIAEQKFFSANTIKLLSEELTLRNLYMTGMLTPPLTARLKIRDHSESRAYARKALCYAYEICLTRGIMVETLICACELAVALEAFLALRTDANDYPPDVCESFASGHQMLTETFQNGVFWMVQGVLPRSIPQQIVAYTIAVQTLEYILTHEAAHVTHGHLELNRELRGAGFARQVMETYADDAASMRTLFRFRINEGTHDFARFPLFDLPTRLPYRSIKDYINLHLVSLILSYALLGNSSDVEFFERASEVPTLEGVSSFGYPPAAYRLWRATNRLSSASPVEEELRPFFKPLNADADGHYEPNTLFARVKSVLMAAGYEKCKALLIPLDSNFLNRYDEVLTQHASGIAAHTLNWRRKNIDPTRPPPDIPIWGRR